MIRSYALIIKPTHMCNFNCKYCYDAEARRLFGNKQMTLQDVSKILDMFPEPCELEWVWHGGEPTTMPFEFFRDAQDLFKSRPHLKIHQGMQSNCYHLTDDLLDVIQKYEIGLGASFDGLYQDVRKEGSTAILRANFDRIKKRGMNVGCICVVTPENINELISNYKFITEDVGISVSFNPIFYSVEAVRTGLDTPLYKYSKSLLEYYKFMWHENTGNQDERSATEAIHALFSTGSVTCHLKDCRFRWIGIDPNGRIAPCDRTLTERYNMGTIYDPGITVDTIFNSTGYRLYTGETDYRFTHDCQNCGYWDMCNGLCNSIVFAKWESFRKVIPDECRKFATEMDMTFDHFLETDIYTTNSTQLLLRQLLGYDLYTPREVIDFLNMQGYAIPLTRDNSIPLPDSIQYKLFRIFNPNSGKRSSCAQSRPRVGYLLYTPESAYKILQQMPNYRGLRMSALRDIYMQNREEITNLCK